MGELKVCRSCGRAFTLSRAAQDEYLARGLEAPRRCPTCLGAGAATGCPGNRGDDVGKADRVRVCVDCGAVFSWSRAERAFYRERGFEPPRRCETCRQIRRSLQHEQSDHGALGIQGELAAR